MDWGNLDHEYKALRERQKRWLDCWIETTNATEAALRAGYSRKTASRIGSQNYQKLEKFIQFRLSALASERIMQAQEVMELLSRIARGQEEQECRDQFGNSYQRKPTIKERTTAAELIGKRYSLFTDKVQHSGVVGVSGDFVLEIAGECDGDDPKA